MNDWPVVAHVSPILDGISTGDEGYILLREVNRDEDVLENSSDLNGDVEPVCVELCAVILVT